MWCRMESCGGLATRLERRLPTGAQLDKLPHKGTHFEYADATLQHVAAPDGLGIAGGASASSRRAGAFQQQAAGTPPAQSDAVGGGPRRASHLGIRPVGEQRRAGLS